MGVNALVDDPRSQPASGAPNGRLYVGTDVGVYVSVNGGGSWTLLGVGLPHAPVIDLQFNQNLEELVAGTQGRGAFMISTDEIGPHVVAVTPATPVNPLAGSLTSVTVTFNEAIGSFPLSQITITGPGGQVITPLTVTDVSVPPPGLPNPHNVFQITFAAQSAEGIYTFKVGPDVTDLVGNDMDQNQNGINGENPGDIFTFTVDLNSTDDGRFVSGLYNDVLGRPADTVGFETILGPIDAARNALLSTFASSFVTGLGAPQLVMDLYQSSGATYSTSNPMSILGVGDLLGRPENASEQAYWASVLQGGGSFEQIITAIIGDPSYFDQTGAGHDVNGNDTAFVTQVYEDLFNRAPSSYELNTLFVPQLAAAEAAARTQDARNLLAGQAYQTGVITADYNLYLKRNPTSGPNGEIAYQLGQLQTGTTQDQLVANILGSPEYFNLDAPKVVGGGATASNDTWIRAVYAQLFPNYTIHASEENYWDGLLNSNQLTLTQVAFILDTSSLYRFGDLASNPNNFVNGSVDRAYKQFLGRDATTTEISYWQNVYAANPNYRVEDLDAAILGSGEYFAKNTTANTPLPSQDQQWANALYTSVLGTTNSSAEANIDLPFLTAAEVKRPRCGRRGGGRQPGVPQRRNELRLPKRSASVAVGGRAGPVAADRRDRGGHGRRPQRRRTAADRRAQLAGILPGPVRPVGGRPAHQQLVADEPLRQPPGPVQCGRRDHQPRRPDRRLRPDAAERHPALPDQHGVPNRLHHDRVPDAPRSEPDDGAEQRGELLAGRAGRGHDAGAAHRFADQLAGVLHAGADHPGPKRSAEQHHVRGGRVPGAVPELHGQHGAEQRGELLGEPAQRQPGHGHARCRWRPSWTPARCTSSAPTRRPATTSTGSSTGCTSSTWVATPRRPRSTT